MLNHHPAIVTEIEEAVVVEKAALAVAEEEGGIVNAVTDHHGKNATKNRDQP